MADEHAFTVSIEASGEVTPAPVADPEPAVEPERDDTYEAEPRVDDEESADG